MSNIKKIGIRVDMNENIATGQFMRCATVADRLISRGCSVVFISADDGIVPLAEKRGFSYKILGTDWQNPEGETDVLVDYLGSEGITHLLIDSYEETEKSLDDIRKAGIKTAYFDDLDAEKYPVDMLINYSSFPDEKYYRKKYQGTGIKLMLGPSFVPLRPQFTDVEEHKQWGTEGGIIGSKREPVLFLTTGGSDPIGIVKKITDVLFRDPSWDKATVHLLAGRFYEVPDDIKNDSRVIIHRGIPNVAEIMSKCDAAVTTAGTTMYELGSCGVPMVSYIFADNMKADAEYFDREGLIPYAGDFREDPEDCAKTVVSLLDDLLTEGEDELQSRVADLMTMFDGHGADRIADALLGDRE